MDYLVCVNINNNDKLRYIVPVIADNDFDAGIKAHEQLRKWKKEGYKYVEISICNGTGEIKQTNEEWFCGLSTEEKAEWLKKHMECDDCPKQNRCNGHHGGCTTLMVEWLKEKHTNGNT